MYNIIYICITEINYKELAHVIIKTEKSQDLPSASWRPRTAGGVLQSEPESLRMREVNGVNPNPRPGEDILTQDITSSFLHILFYSDPQQIG